VIEVACAANIEITPFHAIEEGSNTLPCTYFNRDAEAAAYVARKHFFHPRR
jgi:hypothetical protein